MRPSLIQAPATIPNPEDYLRGPSRSSAPWPANWLAKPGYDRRRLAAQAHVRRKAAKAVMKQAEAIQREEMLSSKTRQRLTTNRCAFRRCRSPWKEGRSIVGSGLRLESTGCFGVRRVVELPQRALLRAVDDVVAEGGIADDSAPVEIPRRAGCTAVQVGSCRPRSDPQTSVREARVSKGVQHPPPQPRCSTSHRLDHDAQLRQEPGPAPHPASWADPAALQPLGTEPSCDGGWDRRQLPVGAPALRPFFCQNSGIFGPMDGDSLQGQEGGIVRSWLDSRNFLPGLRTTARRPYKQEVAGSNPAVPIQRKLRRRASAAPPPSPVGSPPRQRRCGTRSAFARARSCAPAERC